MPTINVMVSKCAFYCFVSQTCLISRTVGSFMLKSAESFILGIWNYLNYPEFCYTLLIIIFFLSKLFDLFFWLSEKSTLILILPYSRFFEGTYFVRACSCWIWLLIVINLIHHHFIIFSCSVASIILFYCYYYTLLYFEKISVCLFVYYSRHNEYSKIWFW